MIAIASLLFVVALSLVVTRVATVILVATGLSRQSARFQARSAFTGAGFTTRESEAVVDHPLRRRVVMTLMLLGNAGIVASAGSLILGFNGGGLQRKWATILELVCGLVVLLMVSRSARVDRHLTQAISRLLRRYTDVHVRDIDNVLDLAGSYAVSELVVEEQDWVAGRSLADLSLRDEGVAVLGITRTDGTYRGAPVGSTVIHPGDILVLYGHGDALEELDRRAAGPAGDRSHARAVAHQQALVAAEQSSDEEGVVPRTG